MKSKKILFLISLLLFISIYNLFFVNIETMQTNKTHNYNVIFAGTVRNVEKYINNILIHINECGKKFNDYCLIIYENDSSDKTREILNKNKRQNYYYIFENNVNETRRTMRLANGRNQILNKVNEINQTNYFDYLIMLDMDDINESGTFVDTIDTCFKYDNWDVLTGNQTGKYYDIWALRKKDVIMNDFWIDMKTADENNDENKKKELNHILRNTHFDKNGLLEVDSAFGGIAIYKISSIGQCKYIGEHPDGSENCEHVEFHKCIKQNGGKIFINTEFYTS